MTLREIINPTIRWRDLWLATIVLMLGMAALVWLWDPHGHRENESKLRIGMTEAEVLRSLGAEPALKYDRATAPADYYVDGWCRRERPITHRVLIFKLGESICYVWFDQEERVEDFFVGGS